MRTIVLKITDTNAKRQNSVTLTSGAINDVYCQFDFDTDWSAFTARTATFIGAGETKTVPLITTDPVAVPWECLKVAGGDLIVGVTGLSYDDNGDTNTVHPTLYSSLGKILQGADLNADPATEPTPTEAEQILHSVAAAEAAAAAAEAAKATTVTIGTVSEGDTPDVTNAGTEKDAILNFVLQKGNPGQSATIAVGTVAEGDTPSVTNAGTNTEAVFDFTLPAKYVLPAANATTLGGFKVGDNLTIDGDGVLSANKPYRLIKTIALTENVSRIDITTDNNGLGFNITEFVMYAYLVGAGTETGGWLLYLNNVNTNFQPIQSTVSGGSRYWTVRCNLYGTKVEYDNSNASVPLSYGTVNRGGGWIDVGSSGISNISFRGSAVRILGSGTTFEIWGR